MMALNGSRAPNARQSRERLSVSRPCVELALGSLTIDGYDVAAARAFGNRIAVEAERWMQRGGFPERSRISKADAGRMLAQALAQLPKIGAAGVLAGARRDTANV